MQPKLHDLYGKSGLNHILQAWVDKYIKPKGGNPKPTCTTAGVWDLYCSYCGKTWPKEVDKLGHEFPEEHYLVWAIVQPAFPLPLKGTETMRGEDGGTCKVKYFAKSCYAEEHFSVYCANGCGLAKFVYLNDVNTLPTGIIHTYYIFSIVYTDNPETTVVRYKCKASGCPYDASITLAGHVDQPDVPLAP